MVDASNIVAGFLVFSLAVLVSSIIPFVPDLRVAIDNGMMFLFFISGVFLMFQRLASQSKAY